MQPITARDLMNPTLLTVDPGLTVEGLAAFLVDNQISGAPVVGDGRLLGVVSLFDVADSTSTAMDAWMPGYQRGPHGGGVPPIELREAGLLVEDIMTSEVVTVDEDASVTEVAQLMVDRHLHRLLVLRGSELVGLISTSDLLGLLLEGEG